MILTLLSTIIVLSILIIFHEFGHFIVAKRSGIKVEVFSLGLGPKLVGITKGETSYRLSLIPFGGYVKMAGDELKEAKGVPNEFFSKRPAIRTAVVVAGPFFNLILAWIFFIIVSFIQGINELPTTTIKSVTNQPQLQVGDKIISINGIKTNTWDEIFLQTKKTDSVTCVVLRGDSQQHITIYGKDPDITPLLAPIVGRVIKDGRAWKSGIRENDIITRLTLNKDTLEISNWDTLVAIIQNNYETPIGFTWLRNNSTMNAIVTPEKTQIMDEHDKVKDIGIIGVQLKTIRKNITFFEGIKDGTLRVGKVIDLVFRFFKKLFIGKISPKLLGGPVAIGKFAGESARWGIDSFMTLIAFLSIQLFLLNLIPFPPLDGGVILLICIEKIQRHPISEKTTLLIQNIGFGLLMLLMIYVTFNDILRLITK